MYMKKMLDFLIKVLRTFCIYKIFLFRTVLASITNRQTNKQMNGPTETISYLL